MKSVSTVRQGRPTAAKPTTTAAIGYHTWLMGRVGLAKAADSPLSALRDQPRAPRTQQLQICGYHHCGDSQSDQYAKAVNRPNSRMRMILLNALDTNPAAVVAPP